MSVAVNVALRVPVAAGVKLTLMVQLPLAAKVEGLRGQLLVCPKSPGLVPAKPMFVMVNAAPLGFESVTALAVLVAFTISFELTLLVTSRAPLRVNGEREYAVAPLLVLVESTLRVRNVHESLSLAAAEALCRKPLVVALLRHSKRALPFQRSL